MKPPRNKRFSLLLLLWCFVAGTPVLAQEPAPEPEAAVKEVEIEEGSMRQLIESTKETEKLLQEKSESNPTALLTGETPLDAMLGLLAAVKDRDMNRAGEFLDMRYLPEEVQVYTPAQLMEALSLVFNQQNVLRVSELSDDPRGHQNDGLPSYRDLLGTIRLATEDIPIYLQRVPDGKGGKVWKLSNATVARIPDMWEELGYSPIAVKLSRMLPDFSIMGMQNWQVLATILFLLIGWPVAALITNLLLRLALLIPNNFPRGITRFFRWPLRFFVFIFLARELTAQLGLSLKARIILESSGVDYIAGTVLLLGLMSLLRDYQMRKMEHSGKAQYAALLKPLTTIVKFVVVIIIALVWANQAGYNMSTVIAGLGVGSLAVALAAQKTLENVIGAGTLYAARPVNPGDFCRFGNIVGTVEEIGLRSTLIRTLDRTLVVIPNAVFSSLEVENFSVRDRIRYYRRIHLQMANADQLRLILAEARRLFYSHPRVIQESVSVRLESIEQATVILRLDAGVDTRNYQEYLAIAEDLNLRLIELVHGAGAAFSGPGQVLQVRDFKEASDQEMAAVQARLAALRGRDALPFPDFTAEELQQLKGTLDYPERNTSS